MAGMTAEPASDAALLRSRITLRSNPRALAPLLLPPALIAAAAAVALLADAWPVLIAAAPIGLIGYRVTRYLLKQFRSRVRVYEDRIELDFMGEEQAVMRWTELTRAGLAANGRRRSVFLYRGDVDQLVELSDEFESFGALAAAVRERTDFEEIDLRGARNVADYLRAEAAADDDGAGPADDTGPADGAGADDAGATGQPAAGRGPATG